MTGDKLINKKEAYELIGMKNTKFEGLVEKGFMVKPIYISGFSRPLFSFNEIQNWIEEQKKLRDDETIPAKMNNKKIGIPK